MFIVFQGASPTGPSGVFAFGTEFVHGAPPAQANANSFGVGGPVKETVTLTGKAVGAKRLKGVADSAPANL